MFGLIIMVVLVIAGIYYSFIILNKLNKSGKLSYISYARAEAYTKCTIADYEFFEQVRK